MVVQDFQTQLRRRLLQRLVISNDSSFTESDGGCACICAIKDEAPYIHEYIHHHLRFGFNPIVILVNRTTDQTEQILKKISCQFSGVIVHNINWIDFIGAGSQIQSLGYIFGLALLRQSQMAKYALLSDADELWFSTDANENINSWITKLPAFDQVSFCWAKQMSREAPFEAPFLNKKISTSWQIKSLVRVNAQSSRVHMHRCFGGETFRHIDPDGKRFVADEDNEFRYSGNPESHNARILHRMQRSEDEYLALLTRGRPYEGEHRDIKLNREGYRDEYSECLNIPAEDYNEYLESLKQFIDRCEIDQLLRDSRAKHLLRGRKILEILSLHPELTQDPKKRALLAKVLSGTKYAGLNFDSIRTLS